MKRSTVRNYVWWAAGLVVAGGLLWFFFVRTSSPVVTYESTPVEWGEVMHVVNVTGHAEPMDRLTLSFAASGRLARLFVREGDEVYPGMKLAILEQNVDRAALSEREARLAREEALLTDLLAGVGMEERDLTEASRARTALLLERAYVALRDELEAAYVVADDAIQEKADEVFGDTSDTPRFGITFEVGTTNYVIRADAQTSTALTEGRAAAAAALERMSTRRAVPREELLAAGEESGQDLALILSFLSDLAAAVNRYVPKDSVAQTVYETYQTSVATARTAVQSAIDGLRTAQSEVLSQEAALAVADRELDLKDAAPRSAAVRAQEASVQAARSAHTAQEAALDLSVLRSPIGGVVNTVALEEGETATIGAPVVEVLAPGSYEIVAYIPEADIASIRLGQEAKLTFDAFDRTEVFSAQVNRISIGDTLREGVPTYKTVFVITQVPETAPLLRAGMTADIDIMTAQREDVLYVPSRSVFLENGQATVRTVGPDGELRKRSVELGLRGSEGTTEIREGLAEGEEVVLYVEGE